MNGSTGKKIVIVGGGFAGIRSALMLSKKGFPGTITLISEKTYFEYYPAMYRVSTGSSPLQVIVPLATIFKGKNVEVVTDSVLSVDMQQRSVKGKSGTIYVGDYLILALGSETSYFDIPGAEELSFSFKSIEAALELKERIHTLFTHHVTKDKEETLVALHFVIIGGGASGVELAGELALYTKKLAKTHGVDPSLVTIDLVEAAARILPMMPPHVSEKAARRLRKLGVHILLNRMLVKNESWTVFFKDMSVGAKTVIWTAGAQTNRLYRTIPAIEWSGNKRVVVDKYLQANGFENVFVIGDAAATQYSGLAQTALHNGKYVADLIMKKNNAEEISSYVPKRPSYDVPVGPGWAILMLPRPWSNDKWIIWTGRLSWIARHLIDIKFFFSILPFFKALKILKGEKI